MTPLILEISDKMPTPFLLWVTAAVLGAVLFFLGRLYVALPFLLLPVAAVPLWGACHEAFYEGSFSAAIREELGSAWIWHSVVSSSVPVVAVVGGILAAYGRRPARMSRAS